MFTNLQRALMDLVTAFPKKDLQNRKEIRDTILELQSELERAIVLTTVYLDGIPRIRPIDARQELLDQLSQAPSRLLDAYNEFKICAGIYGLADKFRTLLSGIHNGATWIPGTVGQRIRTRYQPPPPLGLKTPEFAARMAFRARFECGKVI